MMTPQHLRTIFDAAGHRASLTWLLRAIRELPDGEKPDSLVGRGESGMGVVWPLHAVTGIPVYVVRKDEQHHGSFGSDVRVQGQDRNAGRYLIVDDGIASGATVREIVRRMQRDCAPCEVRPLGALFYKGGVWCGSEKVEHLKKELNVPWMRFRGKDGCGSDSDALQELAAFSREVQAWLTLEHRLESGKARTSAFTRSQPSPYSSMPSQEGGLPF